MTAAQFREFLSECRETPLWRWMKEMRDVVTLYDLVQHLVKPWTRGTGCGIALLMNHQKPCRAKLMISHTWAEDMDECEEAIVDYCLEETSGLSTSVWFCGFAQYQAGDEPDDVGPSISEQLELDPFGSVIRHTTPALGMVVVHTSSAGVYERLWCVYEIAEATRLESKVGFAFSERYLNQRHTSLVELLKARTDSAVCSNPADTDMIRSRIHDLGGFRALDWKIFSFRLQSLRAVLAKKDPNWQDMLSEELQRAEEELNNWSLFGRAKSEKPLDSHTRSRMMFLVAMGSITVGLVVCGGVAVASLIPSETTEDYWPEPDGPTTTTTCGFGKSGCVWPPPPPSPPQPEDDSPAPAPAPPAPAPPVHGWPAPPAPVPAPDDRRRYFSPTPSPPPPASGGPPEDNWPAPAPAPAPALAPDHRRRRRSAPAPAPPEDNWPAPAPAPPPLPVTTPVGQPEPLGGTSPRMVTPLLVTLVSLLFLGGVCLLLVCVLAMRRCRAPRKAQENSLERSQLDWAEKLKLAKEVCLCDDAMPSRGVSL